MAKRTFELNVDIISASGTQTYNMEAESAEEALDLYNRGEANCVDEELNIEKMGRATIEDVYEVETRED